MSYTLSEGAGPVYITPAVLSFLGTTVTPSITQLPNAAAANATDLLFAAQDTTNTNFNSGNLRLRAGRKTGGPGLAGFVIVECGTASNIEIGRFGIVDGAGHFTGLTFNNNLGAGTRITMATPAAAANGVAFQIFGGSAGGAGNNNGGQLVLTSGAKTGIGLKGDVRIGLNGNQNVDVMIDMNEGVSGQRLLTMFSGQGTLPGAGPGDMVMVWATAATAPTVNPGVGTFLIWVDPANNSWKARGSSGTVTTVAPADPHCPNCGRDFALEWEHPDRGEHFAVCLPCLVGQLDAAGISRSKYMIHDKVSSPPKT
jgi:hypothetical protein